MQQRLETAEAVGLRALEGAELDRPGKVAAFGSDAEDVVVSKERWAEIHRLRAQIARSSGLDRKTVRRAK